MAMTRADCHSEVELKCLRAGIDADIVNRTLQREVLFSSVQDERVLWLLPQGVSGEPPRHLMRCHW